MIETTLNEYFSSASKSGFNTFHGDGNYFWIKHEKMSLVRFPEFDTSKPSKEEIKRVFKESKSLIIGYTIKPENTISANSTLYNCYQNKYDVNNLSKNVRRDIRIAQRNLIIDFANWDDITKSGLVAFADTRSRVGLSDGDKKNFISRFSHLSNIPGNKAIAAWFGEEIAAFMNLIVLDKFVIIQGSFSTNGHKKYCPNNGLADFVLNYFLIEKNFDVVCYGLSSIQEDTGSNSLHQYKVRIGFEAIPVRRIFLLNPKFKSFKGIFKLSLQLLIKILPRNRGIRKASGLFNYLNDY